MTMATTFKTSERQDVSPHVGPASPGLGHAKRASEVVIDCNIQELHYGHFKAVRDTHLPIERNTITAFIGPSGCGKSTALRCINRMNDLVHGFRFDGHVHYRGVDMYGK